MNISGKKKAHEHKSFWPVTPPVTGGSPTGGQGSKFYVLSSEPKEHKSFCPDTRPGGPVTGATRKSFMCKSFMCLFCSLISEIVVQDLISISEYHSPRNITYPKNDFRIIFRLPFHDFDFFKLILENYPTPIAFV